MVLTSIRKSLTCFSKASSTSTKLNCQSIFYGTGSSPVPQKGLKGLVREKLIRPLHRTLIWGPRQSIWTPHQYVVSLKNLSCSRHLWVFPGTSTTKIVNFIELTENIYHVIDIFLEHNSTSHDSVCNHKRVQDWSCLPWVNNQLLKKHGSIIIHEVWSAGWLDAVNYDLSVCFMYCSAERNIALAFLSGVHPDKIISS